MKTKIEQLWLKALQNAKENPIEKERFHLTRLSTDSRFGIYGGIDSSTFLLLAVNVGFKPPNIVTNSTSLDYFRQQRGDGSWLMVLRLRQNGLETVFGRLCQDLADEAELMSDEKALVALFRERLDLWQRLFRRDGSGFLQPFEIKGLLAEMLVLESLIDGGEMQFEEAVMGWIGPKGADQDFVFSGRALEVKALGPEAEYISIASIQQLNCNLPLQLVTITLRQSSSGESNALNLNSLSARIEEKIASNPEALSIFKDRLLLARYVEHEYYDTVLFEPIGNSYYTVTENFPKLIPSMMPAGVVRATYDISVVGISSFLGNESK